MEQGVVDLARYLRRLDEAFPMYETSAEAPETFERVMRFIERDVLPTYGDGKIKLNYELPNWMNNY